MTALINLIDTIENQLPAQHYTGEELKQVVLTLMRQTIATEQHDHILTFIEGQSKPHASFQSWADKRFNITKKQNDDTE